MIKILDTTLREGEQTPGVKFTKEQEIKIAKLLDDFGVDIIEAGHPFISNYDRECVRAVVNLKLRAEILAHARADKNDINAAIDCKTQWVGIFCGINKLSLKYRINKSKKEVIKMIVDSIKYAKKNNLKVRYSIEDAVRTDLKDIVYIARLAKAAGADIIGLPDTTGSATPEEYYNLISKVTNLADIPVEAHCHNDLGLALANSLAAYRAGVQTIDATVNGLGERAGLTSLAELCLALKLKYNEKNNWKIKNLIKISDTVMNFSGVKVGRLRPILGENAFTHTADLHQKAEKRNHTAYESIDPAILGRKRKFSKIIKKI